MSTKTKKLLILNMPYVIAGMLATNIWEAWRLAEGADTSAKLFRPMLITFGFWERSWISFSDTSVFSIFATVFLRISFAGSSKSSPIARIAASRRKCGIDQGAELPEKL